MDEFEEQDQFSQTRSDGLLNLVINKEHLKVNNCLKRNLQEQKHSYFNREFQYAAFMSDPTMIRLFLAHQQKLKKYKYDQLISKYFSKECLHNLPDFKLTINWHCDSDFIPFLSKLAPRDTIRIFHSSSLKVLRIDFNHNGPQYSQSGADGGKQQSQGSSQKKAMSLVFERGEIKLVDHHLRTVSCDLYDLLVSDGAFNNLDGEAIEIANSLVIEENQIVKLINQSDDRSKKQGQGVTHKKMEICLQNWERRRILDTNLFHKNLKLKDLSLLFEDVMISEKQIPIDVCLRKDEIIKQKHLIQTLEVLSCIYPEVKKVKKLASIIMRSVSDEFIPQQIKIPVVSSLGIKAIVNIGNIDYTPFSPLEKENIFMQFKQSYKNLRMTDERVSKDKFKSSSFVAAHQEQSGEKPSESFTNQTQIIPNENSPKRTSPPRKRKTFKVDLSQKMAVDTKPVLKIKQRTRTSKIEPPRIFLTKMQKSTETLQSQTPEILVKASEGQIHPKLKQSHGQQQESRNLQRIRSSQVFTLQDQQSETVSTLVPNSNFQSAKSSILKVQKRQSHQSKNDGKEVKYIQNTPICKLMAGRMSDVAVRGGNVKKSGSQVFGVKIRGSQNRMSRGDAGRILQTEDGGNHGKILQTQGSEGLGGSVKSLSQSRSLFSKTNKLNYVSQASGNQSIYKSMEQFGASKGKMGSRYNIPTKKQTTDGSKFDDQMPYIDSCVSKFNSSQNFENQISKKHDTSGDSKQNVYGSLMVHQKKPIVLNPSKVKIKVIDVSKYQS